MVTDNDIPPVPAAAEHTTLLRSPSASTPSPGDADVPPPDPKLLALLAGAAVVTIGLGAAFSTGLLSGDSLVSLAEWFEARGPDAIFLYGIFYFLLELVAVPAIPLTLGSGYLFGVFEGTVVVSIASTLAATAAFLISRYGLRAQISRMANQFPRFVAMDSAIGKEGFKFVFLLRLSPLLPFSISNYLYGLTSVRLDSFVLGSWLGMLPGSIAYVSAGAALNALTDINDGKPQVSKWLIALGVAATILVLYFLGKLAGNAVKEAEERGAGGNDAL